MNKTKQLMKAILVSILLGFAWSFFINRESGHDLNNWFYFMLAGATAGVAAGLFTIWSKIQNRQKERFISCIATLYIGVTVYFLAISFLSRNFTNARWEPIQSGELITNLIVAQIYLLFAMIYLLPMTILSRLAVWKAYTWQPKDRQSV